MLNRIRIRTKTRGDTIVEVMIVLAILGLAVGIAYATASKSLLDTSQAEENSQASEFAQAQMESVRYLSPTSTTNTNDPLYAKNGNIFRPTNKFCITNPTAAAPILNGTVANCSFGSVPYIIYVYNCDQYGGTPNPCASTPANSDSFVVVATWPDVAEQGTDTVTMTYRVHTP